MSSPEFQGPSPESRNGGMREIILNGVSKLGIETVGITSKTDYSHLEGFLISRKNKDQSCEFEEQNINKRLNAKNLFPECRSIIAIGVPYGQGYKIPFSNNKGLLSVSSHGLDYHKKVNLLLNKFAEEIMKSTSFKYVATVDTSFLIDKEICKSSGLGNYGKNSLLINKNLGSFMNLAYLLTDIEIEDEQEPILTDVEIKGDNRREEDICGSCNICVKYCPNKAIFDEGGINPIKCVSYLTQTKNYIPLEYRESMGRQIYGCDICQIVCPKNKEILNRNTSEDYSDLIADLNELLSISNKDFTNKYGHMAGSWRGRNIWKRNGLIALGNLRIKTMFGHVKDQLQNPSEMIKIYAAWSLLKINKTLAKDILYKEIKYANTNVKDEYSKLLEVQDDSMFL